jgi:outer membrane protein
MKMLTKTVAALTAAMSVLGPFPIAQAETKVAVVDIQQVLNVSIAGKAAKSTVEAQMKKGQARLAQLQGDIEKQRADLQKQASVLSASALDERAESLQKRQRELERAANDLRDELARKNEMELSRVVKEIEAVVKDLAVKGGYSFVFERDRQSVVYSSQRIDITPEVVKALDKKKIAL